MSASLDLPAWIEQRGVVVGDGALGTMLQQSGLPAGGCPEAWNLERPEVLEALLQDYVDAGAQLLTTNSFGASPTKLASYGLAEQCTAICRSAAASGRRVADRIADRIVDQDPVAQTPLVMGCLGPTGQLLEPLGPLTADEAERGFQIQAEALAAGGVDALILETWTDLDEATIALAAAGTTGLPVVATMTFELTPRGPFTIMGVDPARAARELEAAGAAVIGANCGLGPEQLVEVVRALRAHTSLPILAQPNAGLPELAADGTAHYPTTPEALAGWVPALVEAGATVIGGCCGTTPDHIRAIAVALSVTSAA